MAKANVTTKSDLITIIAEKAGVARRDVATIFEVYTEVALSELKKNGEVRIPDLGKFVTQKTKRRTGRNPATGKEMIIPAKTKLKFRAAKIAKDKIK